jgi:hypothetical protein
MPESWRLGLDGAPDLFRRSGLTGSGRKPGRALRGLARGVCFRRLCGNGERGFHQGGDAGREIPDAAAQDYARNQNPKPMPQGGLRQIELVLRAQKGLRRRGRSPLVEGIRIDRRRQALIIRATLLGVHENADNLMQPLHLANGGSPQFFVRLAIRVQHARQSFVGLADLFDRRVIADAEFLVKIHHAGRFSSNRSGCRVFKANCWEAIRGAERVGCASKSRATHLSVCLSKVYCNGILFVIRSVIRPFSSR